MKTQSNPLAVTIALPRHLRVRMLWLRELFGEDLKFPNGGRLGGVEYVQSHEAGLDGREGGRETGAGFGAGIGHFPFFVRV